ncbi:hypothetical protein MJH12_06560 [bacterium]|nr:hypothetical protein [bacterium]
MKASGGDHSIYAVSFNYKSRAKLKYLTNSPLTLLSYKITYDLHDQEVIIDESPNKTFEPGSTEFVKLPNGASNVTVNADFLARRFSLFKANFELILYNLNEEKLDLLDNPDIMMLTYAKREDRGTLADLGAYQFEIPPLKIPELSEINFRNESERKKAVQVLEESLNKEPSEVYELLNQVIWPSDIFEHINLAMKYLFSSSINESDLALV